MSTQGGSQSAGDPYVDLLKLNEFDRKALTIREGVRGKPGARAGALGLSPVPAEFTAATGVVGRYMTYPAELSATGMVVLHGTFVHPATACSFRFRMPDGETLMMRGKVVSCAHVKGRAHEVVIEFDNPIDLSVILPAASTAAPTVTPNGPAGMPAGPAAQLEELAKEIMTLAKQVADDAAAHGRARQIAAKTLLIAKSVQERKPPR